ncbi:MAG: UPF0164 family protein [Treponema sp.]|nr:UPF0164 family protein [Treponema sp.]MCL2251615.1 UPF0164 family protein [Treponema sp.]
MKYLKKTVFLAVYLIFLSLCDVFSDDFQDAYGNITDYLNKIYGIDKNAGLTAFPILNIPFGGRSAGMIAFTALSDDISFIELNPAGSATLQKSELAFFHNNWIADSKIEGAAYAIRFGNLGLAAGLKILYLPFTEYNIYGERVSNGYYSEGVAIINVSYNLFSSYYFSGVSFGLSLKGAYRAMPDYTDNFDAVISGSGLSQSAVMGMVDFGILTRFNFLKSYSSREKNTSVALVAKNLGPHSLGEPLPSSVGAAFSYKPIRPLTIAFDFTYPLNLMDINLSEKPYAALGIAVNVTNFLSMRAGFMYKAGSSRISVGSEVILNKIAIDINYTLDMLTQLQPLNRVNLAIRFDLGDGGRKSLADKVDELYLLGLEAYSRGNIDDARKCWEEALRLNPKYEPAQESLDMLNDRENLTQRIEDLYRLDF